jgi:uncharacterized membrane protein
MTFSFVASYFTSIMATLVFTHFMVRVEKSGWMHVRRTTVVASAAIATTAVAATIFWIVLLCRILGHMVGPYVLGTALGALIMISLIIQGAFMVKSFESAMVRLKRNRSLSSVQVMQKAFRK